MREAFLRYEEKFTNDAPEGDITETNFTRAAKLNEVRSVASAAQ